MSESVLKTRWKDRKNKEEFNLCVFGSRTLGDDRVRKIIIDEIKKLDATKIITAAEPNGVCEVARILAKELPIPIELHYKNHRYLAGMFEHRSIDVFYSSDYALFIHDGVSKGTKNEYQIAQKMGVPSSYYTLQPIPEEEKNTVDIEPDWNELTNNFIKQIVAENKKHA